ncbi:hypothetical protein SATMO3_60120 [Sporomusa aerivorans]
MRYLRLLKTTFIHRLFAPKVYALGVLILFKHKKKHKGGA